MRDSWGQNFRTKDGQQVALTGCWRSSETRAQWTDVGAVTDRKMPARITTLTTWTIWFWVKRTSPKLTAQSVKCHGRQASVVRIVRKDLELKCFNKRGDVRKSWLRQTALLVSYRYFWRSFPSVPRTLSSLPMKRCSLRLQQWEKCENRLSFRQVKLIK